MKSYLTRQEALRDGLTNEALDGDARRVARIIWRHTATRKDGAMRLYTGGCPPFYTPDSWRERGEAYGEGATLIVCHDGGALYEAIGPNSETWLYEKIARELNDAGFCVEWCDAWYTRIAPMYDSTPAPEDAQ